MGRLQSAFGAASKERSGRSTRRRLTTAATDRARSAHLLGTRLDVFNKEQLVAQAEALLLSNQFHQIITANALLLLEAERNPALRAACDAASLVLPESAGAAWALKRSGVRVPFQMAGVDLAVQICEQAAKMGKSVFLLGGRPGVSEAAAKTLQTRIPGMAIAGTLDGFFNSSQDDLIIREIRDSGASVCLVAMGMPFQDIWIHSRRARLPNSVFIGVGGTFDVWAGRVARAPIWVQKRRLEWLYRLLQEPWRWKRMVRLPVFAFRVLMSERSHNR